MSGSHLLVVGTSWNKVKTAMVYNLYQKDKNEISALLNHPEKLKEWVTGIARDFESIKDFCIKTNLYQVKFKDEESKHLFENFYEMGD